MVTFVEGRSEYWILYDYMLYNKKTYLHTSPATGGYTVDIQQMGMCILTALLRGNKLLSVCILILSGVESVYQKPGPHVRQMPAMGKELTFGRCVKLAFSWLRWSRRILF